MPGALPTTAPSVLVRVLVLPLNRFTMLKLMRTRYILFTTLLITLTLLNLYIPWIVQYVRTPQPVDPQATRLTRNLFANLRIAASNGMTMLGMDQATLQGEFARRTPCGDISQDKLDGFHSDIRAICHEGPGIVGFDFLKITSEWLDTEPYRSNPNLTDALKDQMRISQRKLIRSHIRDIHARGGVTTIHWHMNNPLPDVPVSYNKGTLDQLWQVVPPHTCWVHRHLWTAPSCATAFPKFRDKIDDAIDFLNSLTVIKNASAPDNGEDETSADDPVVEYVPVILRLFHEQNGNWFWWGVPSGTSADLKSWEFRTWQIAFRAVWAWILKRHRKRGVHNVLWATGPNSDYLTRETFLQYSPPMSQVDVLGFDAYGDFKRDYPQTEVRMVVRLAEELGKIPAATELGYNGGDRREWPLDVWTNHLLGPALGERIAWVLMWHNAPTPGKCDGTYWGPHLGHANADDFAKVCARKDVMMEGQFDYFDRPTMRFKPILQDDGNKCADHRQKPCTRNGGRGYGKVWVCEGGHFCADESPYSECKCRITEKPKAPNGLDYCLWNEGCGFGFKWDCVTGSDIACAKTNNSFTTTCVSFCPDRPLCTSNNGRGDTSLFPCPENDDHVGTSDDHVCAREMVYDDEDDEAIGQGDKTEGGSSASPSSSGSDSESGETTGATTSGSGASSRLKRKLKQGICRVDDKTPPIASNGIQYCIANEGCGYGDKWACGDGHICAKTDLTFQTACVALCPQSCPNPPFACVDNDGRGRGAVVPCAQWSPYIEPGFCMHSTPQRGWWHSNDTDVKSCDCKIYGEPMAANGYPYCILNGGCGFGKRFTCAELTGSDGQSNATTARSFVSWLQHTAGAIGNAFSIKDGKNADDNVCAYDDWTRKKVCASMC